MALQLFAVPLIVASPGGTLHARRVPKYINGTANSWALTDIGLRSWCLISINPDASTLTTLNGAADVHAFPVNLDTSPTAGALTTMKTKIETIGVPANDFTTANTFRQVARRIFQCARFYQRHHRLANVDVLNSITLDTAFSSLSAGVKQTLLDTANDLKLNTSSLSGASTIRQILIAIANQFPNDCELLGLSI